MALSLFSSSLPDDSAWRLTRPWRLDMAEAQPTTQPASSMAHTQVANEISLPSLSSSACQSIRHQLLSFLLPNYLWTPHLLTLLLWPRPLHPCTALPSSLQPLWLLPATPALSVLTMSTPRSLQCAQFLEHSSPSTHPPQLCTFPASDFFDSFPPHPQSLATLHV